MDCSPSNISFRFFFFHRQRCVCDFVSQVRSVLDQTSEPDDKQDGHTGDQTDAQAAGQADAQTGQADAQTGQANAQTAGQPNAQTADQTDAQKTGQTDAQKTGQANAQTSGQANTQTAGQTDAHKGDQTAGQADAQTGDQTDAQTDAHASDQTDDLATAVRAERSNITQDDDEKRSGSSEAAEGPDGKSLKVSENRNGEPASATAEE